MKYGALGAERTNISFVPYTNLKTRRINSGNAVSKTGHKWKTSYFKSAVGERVLQSVFARTI
jgi:hypothetical protein